MLTWSKLRDSCGKSSMIDTRQIFQNEQLLFQTSKLLMKYQNIKRFQNNNKKVPEYQDDFHNIKKESVVYLICALKVSRNTPLISSVSDLVARTEFTTESR